MKHKTKFRKNNYLKVLEFHPGCFIDISKLFNVELQKDYYGIPEKPFRDLITWVGDDIDRNRRLSENFRYQIVFFFLVILYHQVGDTLSILEENKDLKLKAVVYLPHKEGAPGRKIFRARSFEIYVQTLYKFLYAAQQKYDVKVRELGKRMADFMAHSLDSMFPQHKTPAAYSQKIQLQQWAVLKLPAPGETKTLPNVVFHVWSLEELHVMFPALQTSALLTHKYPSVRNALTVDLHDVQYKKMTGSNVHETQKRIRELERQLRYRDLIIVKLVEDKKKSLRNDSPDKNKPE